MSRKRWTEEEEEYLRNNYENKTNKELAEKLNRTVGAVQKRAEKLKIAQKRKKQSWTKGEEEYLIKNYKYKTNKELARELERTATSVARKKHDLELRIQYENTQNEEEIEHLFKRKNTNKCPLCKSKDTGKLGHNKYFCSYCLVEFRGNGLLIPPATQRVLQNERAI